VNIMSSANAQRDADMPLPDSSHPDSSQPVSPPRQLGCGAAILIVIAVQIAIGLAIKASIEWGSLDWPDPRRSDCADRLRRIGRAMQAYHDDHGCFPPSCRPHASGPNANSWRVLLLPYLADEEADRVYQAYRFHEPWDGPHNHELLESAQLQHVFQCPIAQNGSGPRSDRDGAPHSAETCYAMVIGPGALSDGRSSTRFDEIADGSTNTILVVEVADSGIHWAEPRDLTAAEISFRINDPQRQGIGSPHRPGANVLFCDGGVRFVHEETDPKLLEAMTTIAGGEDVSQFWENH
jgi:prepilin-type processing-associated H-X9-DG protein